MTRRSHQRSGYSGVPRFDDPSKYFGIHETIREHRRVPAVVLCHECMNSPVSATSIGGVRCEQCGHRHRRRLEAASGARGA